ncbi:MAG TPA: DUF6651 domain-containing protein [Geobacterales bacterium]|nr:DUF6651 domain-containing protein [Geobacterales bacterium]
MKMENGNAVLQDGKVVFVDDEGKETAYDVPQLVGKISELNGEAKSHRLAAKAATEKLAQFEGIDDPAAAIKALKVVANLDDKKLIDAGEVEKLKAGLTDSFTKKIQELEKGLADKDGHIYKLEVSNRFAASQFINEKTVLPPDIAEATFGKAFKIENGKVVAYDANGNQIYSKAKPGEPAEFEEALQFIVESYPAKDRILKGSGASGSGARQTTTQTGGKQMSLSAFNEMDPVSRSSFMASGGTLTE